MPLTPEQQAALPHCPFCGRAPRYLPKQEGFYVESAICDTCHVSLPPAVWSRRAQLEAHEAPAHLRHEPWTDDERERFRASLKLGPRCPVCTVIEPGQHFPGCSRGSA